MGLTYNNIILNAEVLALGVSDWNVVIALNYLSRRINLFSGTPTSTQSQLDIPTPAGLHSEVANYMHHDLICNIILKDSKFATLKTAHLTLYCCCYTVAMTLKYFQLMVLVPNNFSINFAKH